MATPLLCTALGKLAARLISWANTEMMNMFSDEVSRGFIQFFVIMQMDQAGLHNSENLRIPKNIRMFLQAAPSPELNPVEHRWELREKTFLNPAFKSLSEFEQALCRAIASLAFRKLAVG